MNKKIASSAILLVSVGVLGAGHYFSGVSTDNIFSSSEGDAGDNVVLGVNASSYIDGQRSVADFSCEYGWVENAHQAYSYNYHLSGRSGIGDNSPLFVDMQSQGYLHSKILSKDDASVLVGFQMEQGAVMSQGSIPSKWDFGVVAAEYQLDGKLIKFHFPEGVDEDSKYFVEQQLRIQAVLNCDIKTGEWSGKEEDGVGQYIAKYTAKTGSFEKDKEKYTSIFPNVFGEFEIKSSHAEFSLGKSWLDNYVFDESVQFNIDGRPGSLMSEHVSIKSVDRSMPSDFVLSRFSAQKSKEAIIADVSVMPVPKDIMASAGEEKTTDATVDSGFKGKSLAPLLNNLVDTVFDAKNHGDTVQALDNVVKWLNANPDQASEIADAIRSDQSFVDEDLSARLMYVLEATQSNPASQNALASIISDNKLTQSQKMQAVVSASGVAELKDTALKDALWNNAFNASVDSEGAVEGLDKASRYALGSISKNNPDLAADLENKIAQDFRQYKAHQSDDITASFITLQNGNIHSSELVGLAETMARQHSDEDVRLRAIEYLNAVPEIDSSLTLDIAMNDHSRQVKLSALKSVNLSESNQVNVIENLRKQVYQEQDPVVLGELIVMLGDQVNTNPGLINDLKAQEHRLDDNLKALLQSVEHKTSDRS